MNASTIITPPEHAESWRISAFGGADVLTKTTVAVPEPQGSEILVEVAYCGVCRHDLLTREGAFPNVDLPLTLGHQVSGVVVACGPESRWPVGTRVTSTIFMGCGHCDSCSTGHQAACKTGRAKFMGDDFDGGYAEFVCAPDRAFIDVPDALPLDVAGVVNCPLGTAYHAVHTRGQVHAGDTVVVTGASGGIGLHTISVLADAGARIIAITSRESRAQTLRAHGAHEVIAAEDLQFARRVKELTGDVGADLIIEIVGTPTLAQSLHAVRTGGCVVVVGNVSGMPAEIRPAHLVMKEISLLGTKSCTEAELREVMRLVATGRLHIEIAEHMPLDDVARAHTAMEQGALDGRLVLDVRPSTDATSRK